VNSTDNTCVQRKTGGKRYLFGWVMIRTRPPVRESGTAGMRSLPFAAESRMGTARVSRILAMPHVFNDRTICRHGQGSTSRPLSMGRLAVKAQAQRALAAFDWSVGLLRWGQEGRTTAAPL